MVHGFLSDELQFFQPVEPEPVLGTSPEEVEVPALDSPPPPVRLSLEMTLVFLLYLLFGLPHEASEPAQAPSRIPRALPMWRLRPSV